MDSHRCDLHNIAYVQQVQPFALIQVAQHSFHIDLRIQQPLLTLAIVMFVKVSILIRLISPYHSVGTILDYGQYSVSCALEHGYRVIVENEIFEL